MRILTASLAALLLALPAVAQSAPEETFLYEGYLEDAGTPVNGQRDMTFALFATDGSGGTAVWTENLTGVAVFNGYFSVVLGDTTPITPTVVATAPWLEVTIGANTLGRQQLHAMPYAVRAEAVHWDSIEGKPAGFDDDTDDVGGGTVSSITAGAGLTSSPSPITGTGTIDVNFGTGTNQAARGDHTHAALDGFAVAAFGSVYHFEQSATCTLQGARSANVTGASWSNGWCEVSFNGLSYSFNDYVAVATARGSTSAMVTTSDNNGNLRLRLRTHDDAIYPAGTIVQFLLIGN